MILPTPFSRSTLPKKGGVMLLVHAFFGFFWRGAKRTLFKKVEKNSNQKIHLLKGPRQTRGGDSILFSTFWGSQMSKNRPARGKIQGPNSRSWCGNSTFSGCFFQIFDDFFSINNKSYLFYEIIMIIL